MNIKDIVKNNSVTFNYYRKGNLYFTVQYEGQTYIFPVPTDDLGDATVNNVDKAIYLMRYIRKAIDDGSFVILA